MVHMTVKPSAMDWVLGIILLSLNAWISQASRCTFPVDWRGTWYQSGVAQGELQITKHSISQRGHCVKNEGNKYLLLDREDVVSGNISRSPGAPWPITETFQLHWDQMCYACLVFTPQHSNLLQFKESFCVRDDNLKRLCGRITGDDILHTIVKVPSVPVPCPFKGPYWFSYNNQSNRDCDDPYSEIQECADRSKFIFKYKRCRNNPESNEQELQFQCLATWFNGEKFLYGKFTGPGVTEKRQMYRCFMHSFWGSQGEMAMSADPTCQGLQSPRVGYLTMSLSQRADKWSISACSYPEFLTTWKEWRDIAGRFRVVVDTHNQEVRIFNVKDRRGDRSALLSIRCMDIIEHTAPAVSDNTATWNSQSQTLEIVTYTTNDSCVSMYQCMRLRKRGPAVVELMLGTPVSAHDRACSEWSFDNVHKYVLIPMEARVSPCPFPGSYSYVDKMSDCRGEIEIGCADPTLMVMKASCPSGHQTVEILQCNQNWTEHVRSRALYIIISKPGDNQKVSDCLVYKESIDGFELLAEEDCGGGNLKIMRKPISVIIQPTIQACKAPEPRVQPQPSTNPHTGGQGSGGQQSHDMREGRDNHGKYSDSNSGTNRTPQIDRKDITVISAGGRTNCVSVTLVVVLVTLLAWIR